MNQFLLKYRAYSYCQGTQDEYTTYMLVRAPTYYDAVIMLKKDDPSAHDIASANLGPMK